MVVLLELVFQPGSVPGVTRAPNRRGLVRRSRRHTTRLHLVHSVVGMTIENRVGVVVFFVVFERAENPPASNGVERANGGGVVFIVVNSARNERRGRSRGGVFHLEVEGARGVNHVEDVGATITPGAIVSHVVPRRRSRGGCCEWVFGGENGGRRWEAKAINRARKVFESDCYRPGRRAARLSLGSSPEGGV